jgi:hypothetical protein
MLPVQPKGGSFTGDDKDFLRFVLGQQQVIPAFEEAVSSMKVGHTSRLKWSSDVVDLASQQVQQPATCWFSLSALLVACLAGTTKLC